MGDTILIDDDELQECFRKYEDVAGSYNDHSKFLTTRKRYANLFQLDILDYPAWARTLKADGYATNPQYADRLISLIERFSIARLDTLCMKKEAGQEVAENPYGNGGKPVDNSSTNPSVTPTKPNQPVKPTTPDKPVVVPPAKTAIKVFTAIGSEYPAGASPFSYRKVFENNHTYFSDTTCFLWYSAIRLSPRFPIASGGLPVPVQGVPVRHHSAGSRLKGTHCPQEAARCPNSPA